MGKAGKAKKKQKLLAQATTTTTTTIPHDDYYDSSDEESSDDYDDFQTAVTVLNTLSTRLQLYDGRPMKPLRMALFPLITQQLDKFFEDPPPPPTLTEEAVTELLSPTHISATLRLAHTLAGLPHESFASLEYKEFRRALHPFVLYHLKKSSKSNVATKTNNTGKLYPPGWTSHTAKDDDKEEGSLASTAAAALSSVASTVASSASASCDKKKQSLSNRVAYFYRIGDWQGALGALHELRVSSDMPKLGSLQRWVRESDVETFQLSSMKTEASSHVCESTNSNSSDSAKGLSTSSSTSSEEKGIASIVPSYAIGNELLTVDLSAQELQARVTSQQLLYAVLHLMQTKLKDSIRTNNSTSSNSDTDTDTAKGKRKFTPHEENNATSMLESVHCVVQCRSSPLFHAPTLDTPPTATSTPPSPSPSLPPFTVSSATDALACLHVFQAVFQTSLPVLAPGFMDLVRVVYNIPGQQRRPPSAHDLNIYSTQPEALLTSSSSSSSSSNASLTLTDTVTDTVPETIMANPTTGTERSLSSIHALSESSAHTRQRILRLVQQPSFYLRTAPQRHDIPHVPGAFLMTDVLSPLECCQLMTMAETMQYTPDAVYGIDNVIWLGNESLMSLLASRVEPLMPAVLNNRQFAGINARLRLFRYYAGAVYRPHIDGAWPGSGLAADGTFTDDAFEGDRHSQLTFLVYLNDGFEGGATTFFLPGEERESSSFLQGAGGAGGPAGGVIEARGVKPRQGAVLCFPHGNAFGSLVHEGSAVANGVKYVIRSDALYFVEKKREE